MGIAEVVKRYLRYFLPKMEKADGINTPSPADLFRIRLA
jgi:hypothetical protein